MSEPQPQKTAEQICRDLLQQASKDGLIEMDRGLGDPQVLSSGDLVGMANLFCDSIRNHGFLSLNPEAGMPCEIRVMNYMCKGFISSVDPQYDKMPQKTHDGNYQEPAEYGDIVIRIRVTERTDLLHGKQSS